MDDQSDDLEDGRISNADRARQIVVDYMAAEGFLHDPCLGIEPHSGRWKVELAHYGYDGHSDTTDPSSITLIVDVDTGVVYTEAEDWMDRLKKGSSTG